MQESTITSEPKKRMRKNKAMSPFGKFLVSLRSHDDKVHQHQTKQIYHKGIAVDHWEAFELGVKVDDIVNHRNGCTFKYFDYNHPIN